MAVTIHYTDGDVAGLDETTLVLYYWDTATSMWKDVATTCTPTSSYWRYPGHNTIVVAICHLTQFGLFGAVADVTSFGRATYLPVILRNQQTAGGGGGS